MSDESVTTDEDIREVRSEQARAVEIEQSTAVTVMENWAPEGHRAASLGDAPPRARMEIGPPFITEEQRTPPPNEDDEVDGEYDGVRVCLCATAGTSIFAGLIWCAVETIPSLLPKLYRNGG